MGSEINSRRRKILEAAKADHRTVLWTHDSGLSRERAEVRRLTGQPISVLYEALKTDGRRSKGATILDLLISLRARGIEPSRFFRDAFPVDGEDPVATLREARGEVSRDAHSDLLWQLDTCKIERPRIPDPFRGSLAPDARAIDDLRDENPTLAYRRAVLWIEKCRPKEDKRSASWVFRDTDQFLCYLSAIGTWASIHRSRGRYDLAALALEHALCLAWGQFDTAVVADLKVRAAMVLRDLFLPRAGIPLLLSAHQTFSTCGLPDYAAEALFKAALMWSYLGDHERALASLISCEQLPHREALKPGIDSAYAFNALALGNVPEAIRVGHRLLANLSLPNQHRAQAQSLVAMAEGRLAPGSSDALKHYARAFEEAEKFLEPGDLFLLFFDYAEMQATCGDFDAIVKRGRYLKGKLEGLAATGSSSASKIAEAFLRQTRNCQLACLEIQQFKAQFLAALKA